MSLSYKNNNRRSWFPWMKKDRTMNNDEATFWLSQFIGKNLRIHASDGRVFGGQMKCTDKVRHAAVCSRETLFPHWRWVHLQSLC
jgi:hypothetical protein